MPSQISEVPHNEREVSMSIPYKEGSLGKYFKFGTHKSAIWQYFNPKTRDWDFIKATKQPLGNYKNSIILRNGWVVRKLERAGKTQYYYFCQSDEIKTINKSIALNEGYKYSPGILHVPAVRKEDNIFVDIRKVYFSEEIFKKIVDLSVHEEEEEGRILFLCFKAPDIKKVYNLLYPVRVRLEYQDDFKEEIKEVEPDELEALTEIPKLLSELLTLSYSCFLKKEGSIENFLLILIYRDQQKIRNEELRKKLSKLFELSDNGDYVSTQILNFLIESITTFFDWECYENLKVEPDIQGMIFKAAPISYSERWSNTYYKIIFPELETTLHWPTTLAPTKKGTGEFHPLYARLKTVQLRRWRIYPYLGRIKNTGSQKDADFGESDRDFLKKSFASALGILSFERILSEREYLSGFTLDLEDWQGHYFLDRYFLAIVQIDEPLLLDSPLPQTRVKDIFGNSFIIEWNWDAYTHSKEDIHEFGRSGWISILLKNTFGRKQFTKSEFPVFKTAQTIKPQFHNREFAFRYNLLALIKYFGYVPIRKLRTLSKFFREPDITVLMNALFDGDLIYQAGDNIYYIYKCLNKEQMARLIDLMTDAEKIPDKELFYQKWYITWSLIRGHYPSIHPLIYAKKLSRKEKLDVPINEVETYNILEEFIKAVSISHQKEIKRRRVDKLNFFINHRDPNIKENEIRISRKEEHAYTRYASLMIQNFGKATILASGKRIPKAHSVVRELMRKFSYMEPKVSRKDYPLEHQKGFNIPGVKFEIEVYGI